MDTNKLYNSILTIGCDFKHPKGGVAQVINTYSSFPLHFVLFVRQKKRVN